ncbi:MAG TPA: FtsX-like permease family protein, partial [Ferruginibacter sp.]|nr:FtsX-like permease family protein [Ferruginibacter sp.]
NSVDADYLEALGIKQINGRPFSRDFLSDTIDRVILNQTAVKEIGFTSAEEAVTKSVKYDWEGRTYSIEVLGVVKDFHFQDLRQPIEPYGFRLGGDSSFSYIIAHLKNGDLKKTLNSVEASWHKLNPNEPFEYSFLDEDFQKNYEAESRLSAIVSYFTILAILISCLGLFGLGTFSAEQRNKEIGIRKVLGASVPGIVALLSKDFLKLVIISIVIASPIAWWIMNKWLQDFAFRVNISWWIFMVAGIAAIFITLVTVSFQAIKAAVSNPVKSLRTE